MKQTLKEEIETEVSRMDPKLSPEDDLFKAAAVLIASVKVGPIQYKIRHALQYPGPLIARFAYNLKKSRVWRGRKVYADWADEENGGIAFWCDVNVALGLFGRV